MLKVIPFVVGAAGLVTAVALFFKGMKPVAVEDKANQRVSLKRRLVVNKKLLVAFVCSLIVSLVSGGTGLWYSRPDVKSASETLVPDFINSEAYWQEVYRDYNLSDSSSADEWVEAAKHPKEGDELRAFVMLYHAVSLYPNHAPSYTLMAHYMNQRRNMESIESMFLDAVGIKEGTGDREIDLDLIAKTFADIALSHDPNEMDAYLQRGIASARLADRIGGCSYVFDSQTGKGAFTTGNSVFYTTSNGKHTVEAGKCAVGALADFQKVISFGEQYRKERRYDEAVACFTTVFENTDKNPLLVEPFLQALYLRGQTYHDIGEYQKAVDDFNEALNMMGDSTQMGNVRATDAYFARADAYDAMGEHEKAAADRKKRVTSTNS